MPVAEERVAPKDGRRLSLLRDGFGSSAEAHEFRLLRAARPALPVLNFIGQYARPIRKIPGLGWVTSDPLVARALLNDPDHFTLLSEGGVGHLWAQILGDWVTELFDGPGHHDLRTRSKELFTEPTSKAFVERAWGPRLAEARAVLDAGGELDLADLSRVLVGHMVTVLLGTPVDTSRGDDAYREVFATGEKLASIALGTTADTQLPPEKIAVAREIVEQLTGGIDDIFETADADTIIGRCRAIGLTPRETKGLATLLMVAGTETAASAMARTAALLYDTGEQHRLLELPQHRDDAVREALRVTSPAPLIGRAVMADVSIGGKTLRAGERVMVLTWTANNLPGGFRIDRPYLPHNRQLWFGAGRHLCLGAPLAKAEIGAVIDLLLGDGRPFEIVSRSYGRRVLIPAYHSLVVRRA